MSRTLRIVERARSDVDDIFNWIVRRSVQGAIAWYLAFCHALEKIVSSPEEFGEAAESHPLGRQLRQSAVQDPAWTSLSHRFRGV